MGLRTQEGDLLLAEAVQGSPHLSLIVRVDEPHTVAGQKHRTFIKKSQ